jgi:peptidoglycan hydrolase-like protein with peptidoglycan-binding domain
MNRTALTVAGVFVSALAVNLVAASAAPTSAMNATTAPTAKAASAQPGQPATAHRHGMSRNQVEAIQAALNNNGEHVAVDGIWGMKTASAVKDFQQKHGLKPTGHASRATVEQLHVMQM